MLQNVKMQYNEHEMKEGVQGAVGGLFTEEIRIFLEGVTIRCKRHT